MSKDKTPAQKAPAQQPSAKKRPTHRIYQIEDRGEDKGYFRDVGVCWKNQDGSLNLSFAVIPLIGTHTIQIREIDYSKESQDNN